MAELTVCKSVVFEVSYMRVHAVPLTSIPEPITKPYFQPDQTDGLKHDTTDE